MSMLQNNSSSFGFQFHIVYRRREKNTHHVFPVIAFHNNLSVLREVPLILRLILVLWEERKAVQVDVPGIARPGCCIAHSRAGGDENFRKYLSFFCVRLRQKK